VIDRTFIDRPQLGEVTEVTSEGVQINWFVGSYSSNFRPYKVRGTIVSATIPHADILKRNVNFTKSKRLDDVTRKELKNIYENAK